MFLVRYVNYFAVDSKVIPTMDKFLLKKSDRTEFDQAEVVASSHAAEIWIWMCSPETWNFNITGTDMFIMVCLLAFPENESCGKIISIGKKKMNYVRFFSV